MARVITFRPRHTKSAQNAAPLPYVDVLAYLSPARREQLEAAARRCGYHDKADAIHRTRLVLATIDEAKALLAKTNADEADAEALLAEAREALRSEPPKGA